MIPLCKRFLVHFLTIFILQNSLLLGQSNEFQLLERDFPNLMNLFGEQISQTHADFVIAVDVSRSMEPFWAEIQQGLEIFISAIPDSDYVSIVYFGESARLPYPPTLITPDVRAEMIATLGRTYPTDNRTDLGYMLKKILDELNRPGGNDLKFVFMFTDFWHVPARNSPYLRSNPALWQALRTRFENEQSGRSIESFALLLPLSRHVGQDLDLVRDVFQNLNEIRLNRTTLRQWFQRRRAEILRDRLRYLVRKTIENSKPDLNVIISGGNTITLEIDRKKTVLPDTIVVKAVDLGKGKKDERITWQVVKEFPSLKEERNSVILARAKCEKKSLLPKFITRNLPINVRLEQRFQFAQELKRLNLPEYNELSLNKVVTGRLQCALFPLWALITVSLIVLFVSGCSAWSCFRPVKMDGRITVFAPNNLPINKTIINERGVQIGRVGNPFKGIVIDVPNVNWCWEMQARKNCPCLLWKKAGIYGTLVSGISASVQNPGVRHPIKVSQGEVIYLERGCTIEIAYLGNTYKISWQ